MSVHQVHGTSSDERGKRFFCDFYEQWSSLFGRCNWYDFTLIKIQGEFAPYTGRFEIEMGLLGLQLCFTYVYDDSFNAEMNRIREEVIDGLNEPAEGKTDSKGNEQ